MSRCIYILNMPPKNYRGDEFLAWAWLAKPKTIVIVYQLFIPCHAFTEITEKKNEEKCESQLAKHINELLKRPVETKIYIFS